MHKFLGKSNVRIGIAILVASAQILFLLHAGSPQNVVGGGNDEAVILDLFRRIQLDLESGSASSMLKSVDPQRFPGIDRFRDDVERLVDRDDIRLYLRSESLSIDDDKAETVIIASMEVVRKDSAGIVERRKEKLKIDLTRIGKVWKIVEIEPRSFFEPL